MDQSELKHLEISGQKGKGGGGRTPVEAPNTLASRAIVKVIELLSEGEVVGLAGGAQGIYINDTPLGNSDGSENFVRTAWDYRVGLPDQDYMQGFSDVESEISVGSTITTSTPITRTTTAATIDAVRVTIGLPQGLNNLDTGTGDLKGTKVEFAIDTKLTSSGTWTQFNTYTIDDKTTSAAEKQYRIERPAGTGTWDIRVRRITADSVTANLRNTITFARITEIQDLKEPYNNSAIVGISIDAESVGNQIPRRSYLLVGVKVKVPSNYNPTTRAYTGMWNGTFTTAWTENPAWVLYDLITHPRYGLGEFISENQVDKFSFYNAAVYNDQLVPDGKGGQEPRFTFNGVIASREQALRWINAVAGSMRGSVVYANGQVILLQDRPADPEMLVTNANVIDGRFDYKSTGLFERHTAFNVTYNDRTDRHLQNTVTIDASTASSSFKTQLEAAQDRYGYVSTDIAAFGATTPGQAIRMGNWALDTELNQTEIVQFKMSLNGFSLFPFDIVTLSDADYVGTRCGGRVVSVVGTTVTLDAPVTLTAGSKINVMLADGKTLEERAIVQTSGSLSVITVASAFSQAVLPYADFIVTAVAAPRQFRILSVSQDEPNIVSLEAVFHDPNKYNRVEYNISAPAPTFSVVKPSLTNAPTGLTFKEVQVNNANEGLNGIRRSLIVSWIAPTQGEVKNYLVRYRLNQGEWVKGEPQGPVFEINPAFGGTYEVEVSALSTGGIIGPAATGSYTVQLSGGGASTLAAPTGLAVIGGGSNFSGPDLNFQFTNPSGNTSATLRDFEVRFVETGGGVVVRTVYLPAVPAGQIQTGMYSYSMNAADVGGPRRTVQIQVRCRDASNNLSNPATVTFTNPAPAVPSGISVVGGVGSNTIKMTLPTDPDFLGILVWRSTTSGFTPSSANLIYDGSDALVNDGSLSASTTYYYKVAAYDQFSKSLDGTGLNISAQYSATTSGSAGIAQGSSLPGSGTQGDLFFNTTNGKLYRYFGGQWTAAVPSTDLAGTLDITSFASNIRPVEIFATNPTTGNFEGRMVYNSTDDKLYRFNGTAWISATAASDITGQLTNTQIQDLAASKLLGQVTGAQIADTTLTAAKFAAGNTPVESGATLPSTGNFDGRVFYLTTDKKLYRFNGSSWITSVAAADVSGTLASSQLAGIESTKLIGNVLDSQIAGISAGKVTGTLSDSQLAGISSAKLIGSVVDSQLAGIAAGKVTGTLSDSQLAGISSAKLIGSVVDSQLAGISAGKISGAIADAQLAGISSTKLIGSVQDSQIAGLSTTKLSGSITSAQIASLDAAKLAGQVTNTQIADNSISTAKIIAGSVTTASLAAASITASKLILTDNDSVFPDPLFFDARWWSESSGGTLPATFVLEESGTWPSNRAMRVAPGTGLRVAFSKPFTIEPGATYRYRVFIYMSSDFTGEVSVNAHYPQHAWYPMGIPTSGVMTNDTGQPRINNAAVPRNYWVEYETQFTNPGFNGYNNYSNFRICADTTTGQFYVAIRMVRASNANLIVDGAITADKVAANAIVAGKIASNAVTAGTIAAGAITTGKLLVVPQGINPDPTFLDASIWTYDPSGWYVVDQDGTVFRRSVVLWSGASAPPGALRRHIWGNLLRLGNAGQALRLRARIQNGSNQNVYALVQFYDQAAAYVSGGDFQVAAVPGTGLQTYSGIVTVPAGAQYFRFIIYNEAPGSTLTGAAWVTDVQLEPAADATLIVNGAVIADKIATNAVTADKILAGSVVAGKLAAGAVVAGTIAAGAVVAGTVAAGVITANELATNAVTADKILAGAVVAGKLAAGAVVAGTIAAGAVVAGTIASNVVTADNIQAGAITASKLLVVAQGMNPDPTFQDKTFWAINPQGTGTHVNGEGWYYEAQRGDLWGKDCALLWSGSTNAPGTARRHLFSIMCSGAPAGKQVRIRFTGANFSNQWIGVGVNWHSAAGGYIAGSHVVLAAGATAGTFTGQFNVPINAAKYQWVIFNEAPGSTYTSHCLISDVQIELAASAELIVDGAVTADKIAANAITAGKILAGQINTGHFTAGTINGSIITGNTLNGDRIIGGTIYGDRMVAGTISATQLAAGSVTATKLLVSPSNICPDPDFSDQEFWSNFFTTPTWYFESNHSTLQSRAVSIWDGATGAVTGIIHRYSRNIGYNGGTQPLRLRARGENNCNRLTQVYVEFMDAAGSFISNAPLNFTPYSGQTIQSTIVTPPANTNFVRFVIYCPAGAALSGWASFTAITLDVAADASLVVDGAITADKLAVNSVTAGKILAGTITGDKIAANTITTSKLVIVPQSLNPDPGFNDIAFWLPRWDGYATDGWYLENDPAEIGARNVTLYSGRSTGSPGTGRRHVWSPSIPFAAVGQVVRLRARGYNASNQSGYAECKFLNASRAQVGSVTVGFSAGSGLQDASAQAVVPSGTYFVEFLVFNDSGSNFSGYIRIADFRLDVAASSELIVDGAVKANHVYADAITAGKIAAGAVNTRELAAGSITASKVVLTNGDSVDPDPGYYDSNWWVQQSTWPAGVGPGEWAAWPVRRALCLSASGGAYDYFSKFFPVETGATYRMRVRIYISADFAGTVGVWQHYPSQEWHEMGIPRSGTIVGLNAIATGTMTRSGWLDYSSTKTIASFDANDINSCQFRVAGNVTAGQFYIAIQMVRASSADLIVDGSILTNKLAANAVTADKILAGQITAAKIATNTITADQIAGSSIVGWNIAGNTITGSNIAANTITANNVAADTITADKLTVGQRGGNATSQFKNSDFTDYTGTNSGIAALPGWTLANSATGMSVQRNFANGQIWNIGRGGAALFDSESGGSGEWGIMQRVKIQPGWQYEAHIKGSVHRCVGRIVVYWMTGSLSVISATATETANPGNAGVVGAAEQMAQVMWANFVAPSTAEYADVYIVKQKTLAGAGDSWFFMHEAYWAPLVSGASATNPSPYRPGGMVEIHGGGITASTVTADKINVSSLSALTATIGTLRTATSGARTELSDNRFRVYDSSGNLRVKIGDLS